jgi:hypothetical protein
VPLVKDMAAMSGWFDTGCYAADTRRRAPFFGPSPRPEGTLRRYTDELGTAQHR